MAASPLAGPNELGGVEEFSMDIDSGPEAARREARRRKATGAAESRAARLLCFAPLALSSADRGAELGHPLLSDPVLIVWWLVLQLGTALAFAWQREREDIVVIHLGLLLVVTLERIRYMLKSGDENWATILVKDLGGRTSMSVSTSERNCDSEDAFRSVRLSLRNLFALFNLVIIGLQQCALALGPNPKAVGQLHADSGGLLWTRQVDDAQHRMRKWALLENTADTIDGEHIGFVFRFLLCTAVSAVLVMSFGAVSSREDSGRSVCSKLAQTLFVFVHELVTGVALIPVCLTFFEAMQCSAGHGLDWWGCWSSGGTWWRLFGILAFSHFSTLCVFAQIRGDLLPLFYRGRADILFPARYAVCERLLRIVHAGLTVFLADSEAAYFWASIGCFAAFKLLNAVMAPCCIHQINSLQKVLMELLLCLSCTALFAHYVNWRVDWRPVMIALALFVMCLAGMPAAINKHVCACGRVRVLLCGEPKDNDLDASFANTSFSSSMSFADDDEEQPSSQSRCSHLCGWLSRTMAIAGIVFYGVWYSPIWSDASWIHPYFAHPTTPPWQCKSNATWEGSCLNSTYRCGDGSSSYQCCLKQGFQAPHNDLSQGCRPCAAVPHCATGHLFCTDAEDAQCRELGGKRACEPGYELRAGESGECVPVDCGLITSLGDKKITGAQADCEHQSGKGVGTTLGETCTASCVQGFRPDHTEYRCAANTSLPEGFWTPTTGSPLACERCPAMKPPSGQAEGGCAAGYLSCKVGTGPSSCSHCDKGYYSRTGGTETYTCSECPINKYKSQIGNAACSSCPLRTTTWNASTKQLDTGRVSVGACAGCAYGYARQIHGSTACTACPTNTYKGTYAATGCTPCPENSQALGSASTRTSMSSCACNTGYAKEGSSTDFACGKCANLTSGECAPGQLTCTRPRSSANSNCKSCAAGYYSLTGRTTTRCTPCAQNTYKDKAGLMKSQCVACPAHKTTNPPGAKNPLTGQTSVAACVGCWGGYEMKDGACTACPVDTYKSNFTASRCAKCPNHTDTQGRTAATTVGSCKCKEGYARVQGIGAPVCKLVDFKDQEGAEGEAAARDKSRFRQMLVQLKHVK